MFPKSIVWLLLVVVGGAAVLYHGSASPSLMTPWPCSQCTGGWVDAMTGMCPYRPRCKTKVPPKPSVSQIVKTNEVRVPAVQARCECPATLEKFGTPLPQKEKHKHHSTHHHPHHPPHHHHHKSFPSHHHVPHLTGPPCCP